MSISAEKIALLKYQGILGCCMIFEKTGNISLNSTNIDIKKDKSITKPMTFKGQPAENSTETEKAKVNSPLAAAYFGINTSENLTPLTIDELKGENGQSRFGHDTQSVINLSKKYPHIRELVFLKKQDGTPRFHYMNLLKLAKFYEDKDNRAAVQELAKIETSKGKPRFTDNAIMTIAKYGIYSKYANEIKALAAMEDEKNEPVFKADELLNLVEHYKTYGHDIKELTQLKDANGESINFAGDVIFNILEGYKEHKETIVNLCAKRDFSKILNQDLIEAYEKYPEFMEKIFDKREGDNLECDYKYCANEIIAIGIACNNNLDAISKLYDLAEENKISERTFDKIISNVDENSWRALNNPDFEKFFFDNIEDIELCETYSSDNFVRLETKDKKFNIKIKIENGIEIVGEENKDKREVETRKNDGTVTHEKYYKNDFDEEIGYIEKVKDENGNVISMEVTKPSRKNPGVLVVMKNTYDKDGNFIDSRKIGYVENYGKNGERRKIQKEYVSPLGVTTKQMVLEIPRGKRSVYEIDDKKFERVFKRKGENETETHAWGNKYETKFNEDNIEVTLTSKYGKPKTVTLDKDQIDFKLLPLIKQLPGDFLYTLSKTGTKVMTAKNWDKDMAGNACFMNINNTIYISDRWENDPFVFAHEYGHMIDALLLDNLSEDSVLNLICKKELDAYKEKASSRNEKCVGYFVSNYDTENGQCFDELVAETTALLSGLQHDDNNLLVRAKVLQENFPETISYIGNQIKRVMI
ncbi:hypothetical protein IJI31_04560 [bacterium]|nr:hypothetical protein [bacterium]